MPDFTEQALAAAGRWVTAVVGRLTVAGIVWTWRPERSCDSPVQGRGSDAAPATGNSDTSPSECRYWEGIRRFSLLGVCRSGVAPPPFEPSLPGLAGAVARELPQALGSAVDGRGIRQAPDRPV